MLITERFSWGGIELTINAYQSESLTSKQHGVLEIHISTHMDVSEQENIEQTVIVKGVAHK